MRNQNILDRFAYTSTVLRRTAALLAALLDLPLEKPGTLAVYLHMLRTQVLQNAVSVRMSQ